MGWGRPGTCDLNVLKQPHTSRHHQLFKMTCFAHQKRRDKKTRTAWMSAFSHLGSLWLQFLPLLHALHVTKFLFVNSIRKVNSLLAFKTHTSGKKTT